MASAASLPAAGCRCCVRESRPPAVSALHSSELEVGLQQSLSDSDARDVYDVPAKSGVIITTAASCASAVTAKSRVNPAQEPCASLGQPRVLPVLCCAEVGSSPQRSLSDSTQLDVAAVPAKPGVVGTGKSRCVPSVLRGPEVGAGPQRSLPDPGDGCVDSMDVCSSQSTSDPPSAVPPAVCASPRDACADATQSVGKSGLCDAQPVGLTGRVVEGSSPSGVSSWQAYPVVVELFAGTARVTACLKGFGVQGAFGVDVDVSKACSKCVQLSKPSGM